MADYYPLLARALDGLADNTADARRTVYERAKAALLTQLRSLQPPLSELEIDRERGSLQDAIARAEATYGARPASEASEAPDEPSPGSPASDGERVPRPRVEKPPPIRKGGRRGRALGLALALVAVIGPIAVAAWFWRDDPTATSAQIAPPAGPVVQTSGDTKISDRVAGPTNPTPRPPPAPATVAPVAPATPPEPARSAAQGAPPVQPVPAPASAPARPADPPPAPAPQPELAVAQRAVLIEENPSDPQNPKVTAGRALWRLDGLNSGQGQPLETVVRASVDIAEEGLMLAVAMRRNLDATLPASHTIELTFTSAPGAPPGRGVRDVGLPQVRADENARGTPLAGLSVPVKENVFLIGLSDLRSDVERNASLLQRGAWIDVQMRFASGARANVSFEKGVSGDRVLVEAFRQWSGQR